MMEGCGFDRKDKGGDEGEWKWKEGEGMKMGCYGGLVKAVEDPCEEIMVLWGLQQPIQCKQNALVNQSSLCICMDGFGHSLSIQQSPSSLMTPGVTGAVLWDSGVVLAKFLEHSVESGRLFLHGKKLVELGSGCGLVGCLAALSGAHVTLTDLPDRLKLLNKNVDANVPLHSKTHVSVFELTWGELPHPHLLDPLPDFGSDVIYSEGAVGDLLITLQQLCGSHTTIIISGELRNDSVLEYFLEAAMEDFLIGQVDQNEFHPEYRSNRVVIYIMVKKTEGCSVAN